MKRMAKETVVGIDLGGTKVEIGRVEDGRIVRYVTAAVSAQGSKKQVIEEVVAAVEKVYDPAVAGIGVGVPSVVDVERGIVYDVQNIPSWKEVPLKNILQERFDRPVYINNDANCFAVGEKYFSRGRRYRHLVGLIIGTGLGAGIVLNDRLYSGPNCGAGEFGMIPYKESILEHYCSGQYFIREHGIKGEEIFARATRRDPEALGIFKRFGRYVGDALMIIMLAVDPEAIILGGSVSRAFSLFGGGMREAMKSFPYRKSLERVIIETSGEPQIAVLGAAALYYDARRG
ncbi:MAG: ROK family protein [Candidatus Aminicenantales bacterium]